MRAAPDCRSPQTARHASQPRSNTSHPPQQQDTVNRELRPGTGKGASAGAGPLRRTTRLAAGRVRAPPPPPFVSGDIRYQGFEDRQGLGRGMITIHRHKVTLFETDVAIGCLLGFYLGNGIQAGGGRAHKWCPFWGKMGTTSARVTSITRASDYCTFRQPNPGARGVGHSQSQGKNGQSHASPPTTAGWIWAYAHIATNASMGTSS
jgi:hypothetical protein